MQIEGRTEKIININSEIWIHLKNAERSIKSKEYKEKFTEELITIKRKSETLFNLILEAYPNLKEKVQILQSKFNKLISITPNAQKHFLRQEFLEYLELYHQILLELQMENDIITEVWKLTNEKNFFETKSEILYNFLDVEEILKEKEKENSVLQNQLAMLKNEQDKLIGKIRLLEDDNKFLSKELRELYGKYEKLTREYSVINKLKARIRYLLKIIEVKNKELESLSNKNKELIDNLEKLQQEYDRTRDILSDYQERLSFNAFKSVVDAIKYLKNRLQQLEEENRKLKKIIGGNKN
ncbi:MAG: hypothetical protein ACP6IS_05665 [Candidatus Asgardarchaeia archaeon]